MRYRSLGDSGLLVSVAGLGCNNFGGRLDLQQTRAVVDAAIDAGITLFDTADIYGNAGGSEEMLGARRDQIVLATKFGHQRVDMGYGPAAGAKGGRAYIRRAVEQSLRRLRTDYLDLYQLHTPDPVTPIGETLHALRWAAEHGVSLLDVAIGGLAALPGCASVIAGATSPAQVKANAAAAEWIPPQDALAGLDQIVPPPDPAS